MVQKRTVDQFQKPRAVDDDEGHEGTSEYGVIVPPVVLAVMLTCPSCSMQIQVAARLQTRLTRDSDGKGALALRTRVAKTQHVCGQQAIGLLEGDRER